MKTYWAEIIKINESYYASIRGVNGPKHTTFTQTWFASPSPTETKQLAIEFYAKKNTELVWKED